MKKKNKILIASISLALVIGLIGIVYNQKIQAAANYVANGEEPDAQFINNRSDVISVDTVFVDLKTESCAGSCLPAVPDVPTPEPTEEPAEPAVPEVSADGKLIVVDVGSQMLYAYENGVVVNSFAVSTGLPGTSTPYGDFSIYSKCASCLMAGPGYYLPGVPYISRFSGSYSIHGTYWHSNFGHPMSHGCVNAPTDQAGWIYEWAPIGTKVHVQ